MATGKNVLDLSKASTEGGRKTIKSVLLKSRGPSKAAPVTVKSRYKVPINYNGKPAGSFTMEKRNG
jgi:hypothetical protein